MVSWKPARITAGMLKPGRNMFPELARLKKRRKTLLKSKPFQLARKSLLAPVEALYPVPYATYTDFRLFIRTGNRTEYQQPHFQRKVNFVKAVVSYLLDPSRERLDVVQDYLWAFCEETTWILHAHERGGLDLTATEKGFALAEALHLLDDVLSPEVKERVEYEVTRRVIEPYLLHIGDNQPSRADGPILNELFRHPENWPGWFKMGHNNWNGVCNSSAGAAMLYLEKNPGKLAKGLNEVVRGLMHFIDVAFTPDGASTEGVGYWQYGLLNFIAFSELLRNRTGGQVDLLAHPKMPLVAEYPLKVMLSKGRFYNHADCPPRCALQPGIFSLFAERTGADGLKGLLSRNPSGASRLPVTLRNLLWWDGTVARSPKVFDVMLKDAGIFRLRSGKMVVAGKAGHNAECHNHNDVGSFVLHSGGEDLICDPGAPVYTRQFFGPERYELHLQANSLGHSVPVIDGELQQAGEEHSGRVVLFQPGRDKRVEMEFAAAYPVKELESLTRSIQLKGNRFRLEDRFEFQNRGKKVEEVFVTSSDVSTRGPAVSIRTGERRLSLRVIEPVNAKWKIEKHSLATHGGEPFKLKRLVCRLPARRLARFIIEGTVK